MVPPSPGATTRPPASAGQVLVWLILPWKAASVLFVSQDPLVEREGFLAFAYWVRPLIGWICIAYAAIRFHVVVSPAAERQRDLEALQRLAFGIAGIVVLGAVLIITTRPEVRRATALRMLIPLRAVAVFIPAAVLLAHWMPVGSDLNVVQALGLRPLLSGHTLAGLALSGAASVLRLWALIFCCVMLYAAPRHLFRAADAHPLLPPLLAAWIAWIVAGPELGTLHFGSARAQADAAITLGTPLSLALLGLVEIAWLSLHDGVTFRSGPWPHDALWDDQPPRGTPADPLRRRVH